MQIGRLRQQGLLARVNALVKKVARLITQRSIAYIHARPRLHLKLVKLLNQLGAYKLLRTTCHRLTKPPQQINEDTLTPYARLIYVELKSAISKQQVENS